MLERMELMKSNAGDSGSGYYYAPCLGDGNLGEIAENGWVIGTETEKGKTIKYEKHDSLFIEAGTPPDVVSGEFDGAYICIRMSPTWPDVAIVLRADADGFWAIENGGPTALHLGLCGCVRNTIFGGDNESV